MVLEHYVNFWVCNPCGHLASGFIHIMDLPRNRTRQSLFDMILRKLSDRNGRDLKVICLKSCT